MGIILNHSHQLITIIIKLYMTVLHKYLKYAHEVCLSMEIISWESSYLGWKKWLNLEKLHMSEDVDLRIETDPFSMLSLEDALRCLSVDVIPELWVKSSAYVSAFPKLIRRILCRKYRFLPPPNGEGYVFISVGLCVCFPVCLLATLRKNVWTDFSWNLQGRWNLIKGTIWNIFGMFHLTPWTQEVFFDISGGGGGGGGNPCH